MSEIKKLNMIAEWQEQHKQFKEIIKLLRHLVFDIWGYIAIPLEQRVKDFLREAE